MKNIWSVSVVLESIHIQSAEMCGKKCYFKNADHFAENADSGSLKHIRHSSLSARYVGGGQKQKVSYGWLASESTCIPQKCILLWLQRNFRTENSPGIPFMPQKKGTILLV